MKEEFGGLLGLRVDFIENHNFKKDLNIYSYPSTDELKSFPLKVYLGYYESGTV